MSEEMNDQKTRILLKLWGQDGKAPRNELITGLKRKDEASELYQTALADLIEAGAISDQNKRCELMDAGREKLKQELLTDSFKFGKNIGVSANIANALLKWIREQGATVSQPTNGKSAPVITAYDEFKQVALATYERLNRDFSLDNLVPIYRLRREIGEQVSRDHFNEWLLEMQAQDVWQLIGGEMPDITPDKAEDSVKTALGGVRYYVKHQ